MRYQYIPLIWPLIASAVASLSLGIYTLLWRRNVKYGKSFMLSMFVVTIWSGANALEMSSIDFSTKLFWANMQYFAYCYSPFTLMVLCMEFTGYDRWIRSRKVIWFALIPTIIFLLVWTDRLHGLMRYDLRMDYSGLFPVIAKRYGPAFFIHAIYSHFMNMFAWILLIRAVFYKNTVYKKQAAVLLFGVSLIVLPNVMYVLGISPVKRFDITPIFFGPAGLIIAWGIFRFKLFDVIPVARATVIEIMDAGVMVLDLQDRVLDINPAFEKIVGYAAVKSSTKTIQEVCVKIPEVVSICANRTTKHSEFSINIQGLIKAYEVFLSPLTDSKGVLIGRLVVTYDITQRKLEQQEHLKQQWKLVITEERSRLARDMHDNLGQVLGFINLQAQGIRQELENTGVDIVSRKLDKLIEASQLAHNEIRDYIRNARNTTYLDKDFIMDLTKDILNFEEQTDLNIKLDVPIGFTGQELKPNIRINILSIIKEALNNIRKHAKAKNVRISFFLMKEELCATVEDDGRGFEIKERDSDSNNSFGLSIMRERAADIGAQIDIESSLKKGSRIILRVPLKAGGGKNTYESDVGR